MTDFNFIQEKFKFPSATEVTFDFGATAFKVLVGSSNVITAVWADPKASRTDGRMYITSLGEGAGLSVLDLKAKSLHDWYTTSVKGRANTALVQDDPKDLIGG